MSRTSVIPARLKLIQALDHRVGAALCRRVRPRATALQDAAHGAPVPAGAVRRILVIRPGGLGDAVLTWPMLEALASAFPEVPVDVLGESRNAGAYGVGDAGPTVYCYDRNPLAVWWSLRAAAYDLVIDTEQYHYLSVLVANALRPRWICGFDRFGRSRFHTHSVPHSEDDYEADSFLRLVAAVAGHEFPVDPDQPFIAVGARAMEWADRSLLAAGDRPVVAVMPGAGGAYRLWPVDRYAEVARWLAARGCHVVLLGGPDCVEAASAIAAAVGAGATTNLAGRSTLAQTAAVLRRARVSLSADTGVLHLARGVGTPTVSLFGPGLYRKWGPRGARHRIVRMGLPCSPCTRDGRVPPCPIGVACMQDITVSRVTAALEDLLAVSQ